MKLMNSIRRKLKLGMLVALSGSVLGQGTIGCAELGVNAGLAGVDFCFLFNCQQGFFNGVVQPCDAEAGFTLFIDCTPLSQPFGSGLGTEGEGGAGGGGGDEGGTASEAAGGTGGFRPPFEPEDDAGGAGGAGGAAGGGGFGGFGT